MLTFVYCCIGEDELADVIEEVISIKSSYYALGRALRLRISDLNSVREAHSSDNEQALTEVLLLWLCQKYNTAKFGSPTWRMLVEAVDKESGGNDHELAKKIASSHPHETSASSGLSESSVEILDIMQTACPCVYVSM